VGPFPLVEGSAMKQVPVWMDCGLALLAWAAFAEQAEISLPGGAVARLGLGVVQALAYSPNGEYLAVATSIRVELRRSDTYELIRTLTGHTDGVNSVAFSPDGAFSRRGRGTKQSSCMQGVYH